MAITNSQKLAATITMREYGLGLTIMGVHNIEDAYVSLISAINANPSALPRIKKDYIDASLDKFVTDVAKAIGLMDSEIRTKLLAAIKKGL